MKPQNPGTHALRDLFEAYRAYPFVGYLAHALRSRFSARKTVLFFPQRPGPGTVEHKLCKLLGYSTTANPRRRFDVAFKRMDATVSDPAVLSGIEVAKERIINADAVDIRKHSVARAFDAVFGYELAVDPTRHFGPMVEKSDANSTHDGRVIAGPLPPGEIRPGRVYQKAIESFSQDGLLIDYRVPIHGDEIPLVFVQRVPVSQRFTRRRYASVGVEEPEAVFSATELERMLSLARHMGMDYCELDVLRDKEDELVYVVDVNNTPWGPPWELPRSTHRLALETLAKSFERLLESRRISRP